MRCDSDPTAGLKFLSDYLAELSRKLRLSSADLQQTDPLTDGPPPALTSSLQVAATLLVELGQRDKVERFTELGRAMTDLLAVWLDSPSIYDSVYDEALARLDTWLGDLFTRLDDGVPAPDLAEHRHWLLLAESFQDARTPLTIISDLEYRLQAWERVWADRDLSPEWERRLQHRWSDLRAYGDALLTGSTDSADRTGSDQAIGDTTPRAGMLLLIDSDFRRTQLQRILDAAGFAVTATDTVARALARPHLLTETDAVLCDNLEPSNNLLAVRAELNRLGGPPKPRLILVAGRGARSLDQESERAARLGAHGVWLEPYRLAGLLKLL